MPSKSYIVALSGNSGAGKTSLATQTAALLGDAALLHFDDYASVSHYPPDILEWWRRGGDLAEWRTPEFAADLARLRDHGMVQPPEGESVGPAGVVLVEEPFGKSRAETARYIDLSVHLRVPAEVLLARRLLRRLEEESARAIDALSDLLHRDIHEFLASRELIDPSCRIIGDQADIILDGLRPIQSLAEELAAEINRRRRPVLPEDEPSAAAFGTNEQRVREGSA